MARTSTPTAQRYAAFWSQLLPLSNRRTGFSIPSPRRQASIEFCYLGLCFRYWLHDDQPDAHVQFALQRSHGDTIYASLSRSRAANGTSIWRTARVAPRAICFCQSLLD